ncbi:exported hypothetical protein [Xanthomonas phaseoli pv. phaseoli]|uniref:Secreted protein n=1 Tax=Xanthomonas campestris pv. phaseoli TaxID=317013 RepID=A0ABY1TSQ6_XANCH|nr:exported hypothetical protein [Xanthomonas phaseoli pv. phaseoli]
MCAKIAAGAAAAARHSTPSSLPRAAYAATRAAGDA